MYRIEDVFSNERGYDISATTNIIDSFMNNRSISIVKVAPKF
jgi:hypothetical protein